jgi:uncharacterized protein
LIARFSPRPLKNTETGARRNARRPIDPALVATVSAFLTVGLAAESGDLGARRNFNSTMTHSGSTYSAASSAAKNTRCAVCYHAFGIGALVRKVFSMAENGSAMFLAGVKQFNHAQFFDAHETWEVLWMEASGADKIFLQGAIQVAAAFHHRSRGNVRGARSLLRAGLEKLERFPAVYRGIRVDRLREASSACLDALDRSEPPGSRPAPQIELGSASSAGTAP